MSYSYRSVIDGGADSDMIYYNASIINTQTKDSVILGDPPLVKFNESRDAPIVRDASQYYFSIVRFAMNGVGKNVPLFIPLIQTNGSTFIPQQTDPNLTIYNVAIPYQRSWAFTNKAGAAQTKVFTVTPVSESVIYRPETQNTQYAPVPQSPITGFTRQDLSTRYYWVYTYRHWCDLVNETLLKAMETTRAGFQFIWINDPDVDPVATPFPYPTLASFLADHDVPFLNYNEDTEKFEIYADTRAFNIRDQLPGTNDALGNPIGVGFPVPAFVAPVVPAPPFANAVPQSAPYLRLFMNTNLFALLSNFDNTYYGISNGGLLPMPLSAPVSIPNGVGILAKPADYTNEILFTNKNFSNIINHNPLLQGFNAVPPPAYNEYFLIPTDKQNLYWKIVQDWSSTDSLWSPVESLVFTSTLLPIKKEYTAKPIRLGDGNLGQTVNSASDFAPIIADIVIDQAIEKAQGFKTFTLYEPTAEYRMCSITASHEEIRNIDIQVYWKYRLTGELIPLTMVNCSDVSLKAMFRKVDYTS